MAPCHSVQRAVYTQVYRSGLAVHSTSSVRNSRLLPPQGGHGLLRKNDVVVDARLNRVTNSTFCLTNLRGSCLRPLLTRVEGGPQFEFSQIGPSFLWTRTARLLSNLEWYADEAMGNHGTHDLQAEFTTKPHQPLRPNSVPTPACTPPGYPTKWR